VWDSMDDQDRENTMTSLNQTHKWVIWKTKNGKWSHTQLLTIDKETQDTCCGFKIKGWWRKGDIRVTKPKKTFECWVKIIADVPEGA
jgi:hypothetical protein